jgi:hypothetical protein
MICDNFISERYWKTYKVSTKDGSLPVDGPRVGERGPTSGYVIVVPLIVILILVIFLVVCIGAFAKAKKDA